MHEMSLAGSIVKVVEDAAGREGFERVQRLTVRVGELAGVDEHALRFALEAIAPQTCLAGARIVFETQHGTAWCFTCGATVGIASRLDACPRCGGRSLQPTSGTDLEVKDLIVEDSVARAG